MGLADCYLGIGCAILMGNFRYDFLILRRLLTGYQVNVFFAKRR
jgi:hypothetical protein